jgi:PhzF family phenazine biosynthesis protein
MTASLHRIGAFTDRPDGGNPAGVWIGCELPEPQVMQSIARAVGFSETVFVAPRHGVRRTVRYFSPEAEVAFCGHATIAAGAVLGANDGDGRFELATRSGDVALDVTTTAGRRVAALVSVAPRHERAPDALLDAALAALGWRRDELDPSIPPARAYAGVWHLVLAAAHRARLDALDYDFDALKTLMLRDGLTTVQLVWREPAPAAEARSPLVFHARNPFPVGGVVEDPATGAAAAALGGYLRDANLVPAPATLLIRQGEAMGRPSRLHVEIPASGGIRVAGEAVALAPPEPA